MRISAYLIAPLAAFLLLGCALHKVDEEPEGRLPEYTEYTDPPGVTSPLPSPWWKAFGDENLNALIEESLGTNYQVAELAARYKSSLALTDEARALRFPSVDAVAEEAIEIDDSNFRDFTELGGALFWEVDIFNRLGYQQSAFSAEAQASSEELDALRLTLSAEIAETYYSAIEEKLKLELLRDQRERDTLLLDLTELRFAQGVSSAVDVLQQRSQLDDTVSLIPSSEAAYVVFENRLDVLAGQAPDGRFKTPEDGEFPVLGSPPPVGIPSELLLNRPDLRALKYSLVAADNRIGQAIAERLPNFTITGSYIYAAGSGPNGPLGIFLGSLVQPLLDWGLREARVRQNRGLYEEGLARFAEAYIRAIEDVENALFLEKKQAERLEILRQRKDVLQQTANETRYRYMQGLTDYLPVLTAVQELRQIERNILTEERILVGYRIRLFRAIGGPVEAASEGLAVAPGRNDS